jgi:hypothetical protein
MSKRYTHTVDDPAITAGAAFELLAEENPTSYPIGGQYMLKNGTLLLVIENDGINVTVVDVNDAPAALFSILTYDYNKTVDLLNIPDTYTPVGQLITPVRAAGTYVLGFSLTWNFDRTTESIFLRWRQEGGAWNEYTSEPTERTDDNTSFYEFPDAYPSQAHDIEVEMRKQAAQGILNLRFLDIFFQRVNL